MRRLLVCLALVAAGYTGCGGDDGVSDEDYVARADAICEKANQREIESGLPAPGVAIDKPRAQRAIVTGLRDTLRPEQ
jgi:hypothetical protein